jgi:hypothetical protein
MTCSGSCQSDLLEVVSQILRQAVFLHVRNVNVSIFCMQFWKAVVSNPRPGQSLPLDLLAIPPWLLIGMLESGQSPAMKDRSGYCALFEDLLSGCVTSHWNTGDGQAQEK